MDVMMRSFVLLTAVASAFFCPAEEQKSETVEVEMVRATKDAAVEAALQEAVAQVNGLVVRSDRAEQLISEDKDGDLTSTVNIGDNTRKVSRGVVKGYRELESAKTADGWRVKLRVEVMKYASPLGFGKKPKIAVMPFRFGVTGFAVGHPRGELKPAELVSRDISGMITKTFTQSGMYNVLSRFGLTEVEQEERLINEHAPVREMVKIGQRAGADYLIVGYIRDLDIAAPISRTSQLTGRTRVFLPSARLRISCRKLVVSTAEIAWMEDIDVELDPQALAGCGGRPDLAYETLLKRACERVSASIDAGMLSAPGGAVSIPSTGAGNFERVPSLMAK